MLQSIDKVVIKPDINDTLLLAFSIKKVKPSVIIWQSLKKLWVRLN